MTRTLRLGTRGSQLALVQARSVAQSLNYLGFPVEIVVVQTTGDRLHDVPLQTIAGQGAFVKELQQALLVGHIDMALHCMKDLLTASPEGLLLGAVLEREDPRDVLVFGKDFYPVEFASLPSGFSVATSAARRSAFFASLAPHVEVVPIRGNLDTRLSKLDEGCADALCLAAAGLIRLQRKDRIGCFLDPDLFVPAPAQGALVVELRAADAPLAAILQALHHEPTARAVALERELLFSLGGGCSAPLGAWARVDSDGKIFLTAAYAPSDGLVRRLAKTPIDSVCYRDDISSIVDFLTTGKNE